MILDTPESVPVPKMSISTAFDGKASKRDGLPRASDAKDGQAGRNGKVEEKARIAPSKELVGALIKPPCLAPKMLGAL
jgi:hypothetical protein